MSGRALILPVIFLCGFAAACSSTNDLDILVGWMTGSFSSEQQAASDPDYFDIRLEMVPIWKERHDGHWLYVEQAAVSSLDKPYRQRIYHVTALPGGSFRSEVYAIPDPLRYAGEWKKETPLADLTPESLELREGCAVILRLTEGPVFVGSTVEDNCVSQLRGAAYATSEIKISADMIESWDRGFDETGEQVWGAAKGPYSFLRR